jgi:hypothetical protein
MISNNSLVSADGDGRSCSTSMGPGLATSLQAWGNLQLTMEGAQAGQGWCHADEVDESADAANQA